MKKVCAFVLMSALVLALSSCATYDYENEVLSSLGEYKDRVFYSEGAFQDFTDYGKYYYDSVDFSDNEYFSKIQPDDLEDLNEHLDDFERWIETFREGDASREIVVNYDFDRSIIDSEDYFYLESEKSMFDGVLFLVNYDLYFFDSQTNTLYFFHNNV